MSGNLVETPDGPIILRPPTEAEAVRYEDKRRMARRPRAAGEQVTGALYDDGREELLACVVTPSKQELEADDGPLELYPGVLDRMAETVRKLGGYYVDPVDCPEAVSEELRAKFKRRALGFEVGGIKVVCRRITSAEYSAFMANLAAGGAGFWDGLSKFGRSCLISHQGEGEQDQLFSGRPYLSMNIGAALYQAAQGVAETAAGKSVSASGSRTAISTSQPAISSQPATGATGAGS